MRAPHPPFRDPAVEGAFEAFPDAARGGLLRLRQLVFETAASTEGVGRIEEALRWGQPAYLTPETGSGTTIRLGVPGEGGFALYVHCRTTIIPEFRSLFPDGFAYEGNRAVHFEAGAELPGGPLRLLIASALTYHDRRRDRTARHR